MREIDHLAGLFREVVHIAPLHEVPAPDSAMPYTSARVRLVAVRPAGGERATEKLEILLHAPGWARAILREMADADVVHVRCPASISLVALAALQIRRQPREAMDQIRGELESGGHRTAFVQAATSLAPIGMDAKHRHRERRMARPAAARAFVPQPVPDRGGG